MRSRNRNLIMRSKITQTTWMITPVSCMQPRWRCFTYDTFSHVNSCVHLFSVCVTVVTPYLMPNQDDRPETHMQINDVTYYAVTNPDSDQPGGKKSKNIYFTIDHRACSSACPLIAVWNTQLWTDLHTHVGIYPSRCTVLLSGEERE